MSEEKEYQIEEAIENSNNKQFMLDAIDNNATWVLAYASEELLADKEVILKAVKKDGQVFYYADSKLRDDKEVVMEAVNNKWLILKYASNRLRSDKDVAKLALEKSLKAASYLTKTIKEDEEINLILHPPAEGE